MATIQEQAQALVGAAERAAKRLGIRVDYPDYFVRLNESSDEWRIHPAYASDPRQCEEVVRAALFVSELNTQQNINRNAHAGVLKVLLERRRFYPGEDAYLSRYSFGVGALGYTELQLCLRRNSRGWLRPAVEVGANGFVDLVFNVSEAELTMFTRFNYGLQQRCGFATELADYTALCCVKGAE